ncbi:MAG: hypothetical protein V8S42_09325 [Lachnospiraceae bacterium]
MPDTRRGCIVLYKSQDLYKWMHYGPIYDPGYTNVTECPEMFKMGEYWYISHSRFSESGGTVYRYSKSPYCLWRTPKYDGIGGRRFYAAKSAANDEEEDFILDGYMKGQHRMIRIIGVGEEISVFHMKLYKEQMDSWTLKCQKNLMNVSRRRLIRYLKDNKAISILTMDQ